MEISYEVIHNINIKIMYMQHAALNERILAYIRADMVVYIIQEIIEHHAIPSL